MDACLLPTFEDLKRLQKAKTDELLYEEDLPPVADWDNDRVHEQYGTCSREHHMLQALLQSRELITTWLEIWNAGTSSQPNTTDCQPFELCGLKTYRKTVTGFCTSCHDKLRFQLCPARLQAICKLDKGMAWAGVVTRRYGGKVRPKYIFDGAHRCGIMKPNHCMRRQHVNLETFQSTLMRRKCQRGKEKCHCARQCFGEKVVLGRRGLYEGDLI